MNGKTWQSILELRPGAENLLLYRQLLSSCLGGLRDMEERCMVRYLIHRSDVVMGISS
jgi:hypothetical protein